MWFRSRVIREGQPSTWLPPEPRYQAAEHGLVRVVVGLGSQPDLAVLVELVAWKAARPRLVSCQLGRTRGAVWRSVKRSWRDGPCHQCHRGAPEEPLRTAVRAEMAKSGHALHPAICRSDAPELGVVVVACGGHGEAFCKNEHFVSEMVRAAQASPDHGFCGVRARAGDPSCLELR